MGRRLGMDFLQWAKEKYNDSKDTVGHRRRRIYRHEFH